MKKLERQGDVRIREERGNTRYQTCSAIFLSYGFEDVIDDGYASKALGTVDCTILTRQPTRRIQNPLNIFLFIRLSYKTFVIGIMIRRGSISVAEHYLSGD